MLVYLTTSDTHFGGGTLEFKEGQPRSVQPTAGKLVCYPASHMHRVAPITWGTREVLTLWFTRDDATRSPPDTGACGEDRAVLQTLEACVAGVEVPRHESSMYTLPDGSDLRLRRLASCVCRASGGDVPRGVPACLWDSDGAFSKDAAAELTVAQAAWLGDSENEAVAAQHASASTVVGGVLAWRGVLHGAASWRDAMRTMVQQGLHTAAAM